MSHLIDEVHFSDSILSEKYQLLEELGRGANGIVYKALQKSTEKTVAIKLMRSQTLSHSQLTKYQQRFLKEASICARLSHPHIVQLLDQGTCEDNTPFAVYEYISGSTLKEYFNDSQKFSIAEFTELMSQALDALAYAHKHEIVHRDLKPSNIMVTKEGAVAHIKILDFGIGTLLNEVQNNKWQLTLTNDILGTPTYSSPEQLRGETVSTKSDIYSWGLIFAEGIIGRPLIAGNTVAEVFQKQLNPENLQLPPYLINHPAGIFLRRVLDKNPHNRSGNIDDLYIELKKINLLTIHPERQKQNHDEEDTVESSNQSKYSNSDIRQITLLIGKIQVTKSPKCKLDIESIEVLLRDQIEYCNDTIIRFGATKGGGFGSIFIGFHGYPTISDSDAQSAARSALTLHNQFNKRAQQLEQQHHIKMTLTLAIHTDHMVCISGQHPKGLALDQAIDIVTTSLVGEISLSNSTVNLLQGQFEIKSQNDTSQQFLKGEKSNLSETTSDHHSQMVGRKEELQQTLAFINSSPETVRSHLHITGAAGIGKSRLISDVKKLIAQESTSTFHVKCHIEESSRALFPFLRLIEQISNQDLEKSNKSVAANLKSFIDRQESLNESHLLLCISWLGIESNDQTLDWSKIGSIMPFVQKQMVFDTLLSFINNQATRNKTSIIIEDTHWIDPTSVELLTFIKSKKVSYRIITAGRDKLIGIENDNDIKLEALSDQETVQLIVNQNAPLPLHQSVISFIEQKSQGVPLFVEEMHAMLIQNQLLHEKNSSLEFRNELDVVSLPSNLESLLLSRIHQNGVAAETLLVASVIGDTFQSAMLTEILTKDDETVTFELEEFIQSGLLLLRQYNDGPHYIFKHSLIRDAAYQNLTKQKRLFAHQRIADLLVKDSKLETVTANAQVAKHYHFAEQTVNGVNFLHQAITIAKKQSTNNEAIQLCDTGLNWIKTTDLQLLEKELSLHQNKNTSLIATQGYGAASVGEELRKIQAICQKIDDPDKLFMNINTEVLHHVVRSDWNKAIEIATQFHKEAHRRNVRKWKIAANVSLGQQLFIDGQFKDSSKLLHLVLEEYSFEEDRDLGILLGVDPCVQAISILSSIYFFTGREDEIEQLNLRGILLAKKLNIVQTSATLYLGLAFSAFYQRNKNQTSEYCQKLLALGSEQEPNMLAPSGMMLMNWVNNEVDILKTTVDQQIASGIIGMRSFWNGLISEMEIDQQRLDDALSRIDMAIESIGVYDGTFYMPELLRLKARILKLKGLNEQAEELHLKALKIANDQGASYLKNRIQLAQ